MISRGNLVLALLLVAQVVLLGALALTTGGAESRVVEPLVRDIAESAVQRMAIAHFAGRRHYSRSQGRRLGLARRGRLSGSRRQGR